MNIIGSCRDSKANILPEAHAIRMLVSNSLLVKYFVHCKPDLYQKYAAWLESHCLFCGNPWVVFNASFSVL